MSQRLAIHCVARLFIALVVQHNGHARNTADGVWKNGCEQWGGRCASDFSAVSSIMFILLLEALKIRIIRKNFGFIGGMATLWWVEDFSWCGLLMSRWQVASIVARS